MAPQLGQNLDTAKIDRESQAVVWICLGYFLPKVEESKKLEEGINNVFDSRNTSPPFEASVEAENESSSSTTKHNGNDKMTDKQRRFLFRLLAQKDIRGEKAVDYLKQELDVEFVNKASKESASLLIDQLVNEGG